jgi:hypothetical protein
MQQTGKELDPFKELALWIATRRLEEGARRAAQAGEQTGLPAVLSWRVREVQRLMFLRHRFAAGDWRGEADRPARAVAGLPGAAD